MYIISIRISNKIIIKKLRHFEGFVRMLHIYYVYKRSFIQIILLLIIIIIYNICIAPIILYSKALE